MADRDGNDHERIRVFAKQLREHGVRGTPVKLAVLKLLAAHPAHLGVGQLHQQTCQSLGANTELSTVYRIVGQLTELGLVHSVPDPDGQLTYGIADPPHHHAICVGCHSLQQLDFEATADASVSIAQRVGYQRGASLVLYGRCAACHE